MFKVKIDFHEASIEWNKNKRKTGNGSYRYTCNFIHPNGRRCCRDCKNVKNIIFCRYHQT